MGLYMTDLILSPSKQGAVKPPRQDQDLCMTVGILWNLHGMPGVRGCGFVCNQFT